MEQHAVAFTFVKQGIYDFARKVPNDLRDHDTSGRISVSLRTRDGGRGAGKGGRGFPATR